MIPVISWCHRWMLFSTLALLLGRGGLCFHLQQQTQQTPGSSPNFRTSTSARLAIPLSSTFADSALKQVERLGGFVAETDAGEGEQEIVSGIGGTVYDGISLAQITGKVEESKSQQVWAALATLERDSTYASGFA